MHSISAFPSPFYSLYLGQSEKTLENDRENARQPMSEMNGNGIATPISALFAFFLLTLRKPLCYRSPRVAGMGLATDFDRSTHYGF